MDTISEEEFKIYEEIRLSGETNMFDINNVISLSDYRLSKEKIVIIMNNYIGLYEKYITKNES